MLRRTLLISVVLLAATLLYRLPALLNAEEVNADGAIVGLQAMHMLHGEWSWTLWGAGYQSSLDSAVAAVAFAIFGNSPLVLLLVPITGHLVVTFLALRVIARRSNLWTAAIAVLPLVVTPWAVTSVVVIPPRQWCITLVFIAIWLLDGASESRRPLLRYALGGLTTVLTVFADVYAMLFLPAMLVLAAACILDARPDRRILLRRWAAFGTALIVCAVIALTYRLRQPRAMPHTDFSVQRLMYNADLFWNWCLPFALGYKLIAHDSAPNFALNSAPMPWYALQFVGGWSLIAGILAGGAMIFSRRAWPLRRLGLFGLIAALTVPLVFHFSTAPTDPMAVRYLGPIFWMAPFALAPVGAWLGSKRFALAIAPYLIVAAIGGWNSYGNDVDGWRPRRTVGPMLDNENRLAEYLRARGVHYCISEYWIAYHLTYLWKENPIVAPNDPKVDRYPPYLEQLPSQRYIAVIWHPTQSIQPLDQMESFFKVRNIPYEKVAIGEFTALIADRASTPATQP